MFIHYYEVHGHKLILHGKKLNHNTNDRNENGVKLSNDQNI